MKLRMKNLLAPIVLIGLSTAGTSNANSVLAPDPSEVEITDIVYNGSGCPLGTVAQNISPDNKAFTLTFSEYIAEAGPGISRKDGRRNCQVTLALSVPQGWQFSLGTFTYRGFVFLDKSMEAKHSTSYYFQGSGNTGNFSSTMYGEIDEDYSFTDRIGLESVVWSRCNVQRALNINTKISVKNNDRGNSPDAEGIIGNDSIDGEIKHIFGIRWRRC